MSWSFRTPDYMKRRARYMFDYYGSWSAVAKKKHPVTGVLNSPLPKEIRDRIEADDLCHPPEVQKMRRKAREREAAKQRKLETWRKFRKWLKGRNAR